ncbi:M20 family metallopeptidase [candidate division KSB1 bacterium]
MPELLKDIILTRSEDIFEEIVNIRREFHKIPEPGFEENRTSELIQNTLKGWNIPFRTGFAGTGIAAFIESNPEYKTIAFRADIDALPLIEKTGLAFSSENPGFFHGCGHDIHTACLLGTMKILNELKDKLTVNVKAVFQPGEEKFPGGAKTVIKDGALKDPEVESIFGLHVDPNLPTGTIALKPGAMMASTSLFKIKIIGKGGHAANPSACLDPIPIAAQVINAFQTYSSRMIDPFAPAVISITSIAAGTTYNIIPEQVIMTGTARSLNPDTTEMLPKELNRIVGETTAAFGAVYEFDYKPGAPVVDNDRNLTDFVRKTSADIIGNEGVKNFKGTFGGEDFSEYQKIVPGCFFRLGCTAEGEKAAPPHSPQFNPDERALYYGMSIFSAIAFNYNEFNK